MELKNITLEYRKHLYSRVLMRVGNTYSIVELHEFDVVDSTLNIKSITSEMEFFLLN